MNEQINYSLLQEKLSPRKNFKYSDVKDKLTKIAFDIVRFRDNDIDGLWKIEQDDSGEYIVALYDDSDLIKSASTSPWQVKIQEFDNSCMIFYKNEPITKISLSYLNIPASEAHLISSYLPKTLSSNSQIRNSLIKTMDQDYLKKLCQKYPEFVKLTNFQTY